MDYEDDFPAPERYERVQATIARVPRSCEFCGAGFFVAPGPCSKCGTVGYRSGEPPAFRKMPRTRYDDPPELLPTAPSWDDLEDVPVELF